MFHTQQTFQTSETVIFIPSDQNQHTLLNNLQCSYFNPALHIPYSICSSLLVNTRQQNIVTYKALANETKTLLCDICWVNIATRELNSPRKLDTVLPRRKQTKHFRISGYVGYVVKLVVCWL